MNPSHQTSPEIREAEERLKNPVKFGAKEIEYYRAGLKRILAADPANVHAFELLSQIPEAAPFLHAGSMRLVRSTEDQSDRYPFGGTEGFLRKVGGKLQEKMAKVEEIFGRAMRTEMRFDWQPHEFPGALSRLNNVDDELEGKRRTLAAGCTLLRIFGPFTEKNVSTISHEVGHIVLVEALPEVEALQEAGADFIEALLFAPDDRGVDSDGKRFFEINTVKVLSGGLGWGVPEFQKLKTDESLMESLYGGYMGELQRICGGKDGLATLFRHSKKLADTRPIIERADGPKKPMPRLDEWLTDMEDVLPGFKKRYLQSDLARQMPAGKRIIWAADVKWGGSLSSMVLKPDENPERGVHGKLVVEPIKAKVKIGTLQVNFDTACPGRMDIMPETILKLLDEYRQKTGQVIRPHKGMKITIMPEGVQKNRWITLTWDENAERR